MEWGSEPISISPTLAITRYLTLYLLPENKPLNIYLHAIRNLAFGLHRVRHRGQIARMRGTAKRRASSGQATWEIGNSEDAIAISYYLSLSIVMPAQ